MLQDAPSSAHQLVRAWRYLTPVLRRATRFYVIEQNSGKDELSSKSNIDKLVSKLMQLHIDHRRNPLCTTQCKQLMLAAWSA